MQAQELAAAVTIAVVAIGVCLTVYLWLFDINTGRLKSSSRTQLQRAGRFVLRLVLGLLGIGVAAALIYLAVVYRSVLARPVGALASRVAAIVRPLAATPPETATVAAAEASPTEQRRPEQGTSLVADHRVAALAVLDRIPREAIRKATEQLHILAVYSQAANDLREGLTRLADFRGPDFGGLDIEWMPHSLGAERFESADWERRMREYLERRPETNVVLWLWGESLETAPWDVFFGYLELMSQWEQEQPSVRFVYSTGSVDGAGIQGRAYALNDRIRRHCAASERVLYDTADLESHDPDGRDHTAGFVTRTGWYDSDGDHMRDRNWAADWQLAHPGEWYWCGPDIAYPLIANVKAYAAWWLFARLAGWGG